MQQSIFKKWHFLVHSFASWEEWLWATGSSDSQLSTCSYPSAGQITNRHKAVPLFSVQTITQFCDAPAQRWLKLSFTTSSQSHIYCTFPVSFAVLQVSPTNSSQQTVITNVATQWPVSLYWTPTDALSSPGCCGSAKTCAESCSAPDTNVVGSLA